MKNGKQGRHLFSISYCLASMAAKYCDRAEKEVVQDILCRFHIDFLTILVLNSKICVSDTSFLKNWEGNYDELTADYEEIKAYQDSPDIFSVENYFNVVGAMLHTLSCNVGFSENASDPQGGIRSKRAIDNIVKFLKQGCTPKNLNENIALALDHDLVKELFNTGFDEENIYQLSFMIMQIHELQSLIMPTPMQPKLNIVKIEEDLHEIAFKSFIPKDMSFSKAIAHAVQIIQEIRKEVSSRLSQEDYKGVKHLITKQIDNFYSFSYSR